MKYTYIHSATDQHLICCETHEKVYVDFPTSLELISIPNIVKEREREAIERYERSKEYEIGKWTDNTYLIMRDKDNKVIHHYIWVKKKENGLIGVYDLIDEKFIPFQPKTHITDYIEENEQFQEVLLCDNKK